MKKNLFGKVLAFATLLCTAMTLSAGAAGKVKLEISKAEAQPGKTVELTVTVKENSGFTNALVRFQFDTELLSAVKAVDNGKYGDQLHNETGSSLFWNNPKTKTNFTNKDLAATVTFKIADTAEIGQVIPVTFDSVEFYDADINEVECEVVAGSVTVIDAPELPNSVKITFADKELTYTGKAQAFEAALKNAPKGTTITYSDNKGTENAASYAVTDAGTYEVTATISAEGYRAKTVTATVTVAPKALTVSGMTASSKTYDKTTKAVVSGGKLVGVVAGDAVTAAFPTEGVFAKADVAKDIAVTVEDITLSGADAANYTVTAPSLKADITAAPLTVKADNKSMTTGAALPEFTYEVSGNVYDELSDIFSGKLTTKANGKKEGSFDIIQGTLKVINPNYKLDSFTKGTLKVEDKPEQSIVVPTLSAKTYGDEPFSFVVTPDAEAGLTDITVTSSDPAVASYDAATQTITIKAAGKTDIIVKQAGNDAFAAFEKKQTLTVNKAKLTVIPASFTKKASEPDPEVFTYTYEGTLFGEDAFTGALSRKSGNRVGEKYRITIGTLKVSDNYDIELKEAYLTIVDKDPQTITLTGTPAKVTYGDAAFTLTAAADETAKLDSFTFTSSDEKVAKVDNTGKVTIVGVGKVTITVKEPGDATYAAAEASVSFTVAAKALTVDEMDADDLANNEIPLVGVVGEDKVYVDFSALTCTYKDVEGGYAVTLSGLALSGEDADKYTLTPGSVTVNVPDAEEEKIFVEIKVTAENGAVEGTGKYIKGATVTLKAVADSQYRFSKWVNESGKTVSENAEITVVAGEKLPTPVFKKKTASASGSATGSAGGAYGDVVATVTEYTIRFESNFGSFVSDRHVKKNALLVRPEDPVLAGYVFDGWYTDRALTKAYDFNTRVTSEFTLYAKWKVEGADIWVNPFVDVNENDWFFEAVKYANKNAIMNGMGESTFAPNESLTRAMFVTVLYRMEGSPAADTTHFADVVSGSWYEKAVAWAYANGIVKGISDTEFAPDTSITREQMATILYNYAKYKGYDVATRGETAYTDKDEVSDYAADAVVWMATKAIMSGYPGGVFAPQEVATRAQAATVFMRVLESLK